MMLIRYGFSIDRLGDRYQLRGMLGSGGMADVCLGWDEQKEREVAIKVIKADELSQKILNRFVSESGQIMRLQHPHIVQSFASVQLELLDPDRGSIVPYIVMEYVTGGDLQRRLQSGKPYRTLDDCLDLFTQLCEAVQYAHEQGVIHRDIKPQNILFRQMPGGSEQLLLSDFGLAVEANASHHTFTQGGTFLYMAPEQFTQKASKASDIFALGVVLYRICTGRLPFRRSLQDFQVYKLPIPPSRVNSAIPKALDDILFKAMAQKEDERYDNVQSLLLAVRWACAQPGVSKEDRSKVGGSTRLLPTGRQIIEEYKPGFSYSASTPVSGLSNPQVERVSRPDEEFNKEEAVIQRNRQEVIDVEAYNSNPGYISSPGRNRQPGVPSRSLPGANYVIPNSLPVTPGSPESWRTIEGVGNVPGKARQSKVLLFSSIGLASLVIIGLFIYMVTSFAKETLLSGMSPVLVLTISPSEIKPQKNYTVNLTGHPGPQEVQSRILEYVQPEQSQIINSTGTKQVAGTQATGKLTIFNSNLGAQNLAAGTTISAGNVQFTTDTAVAVPGANLLARGQVTVVVHAATAGIAGNIPALTIDGPCCGTGLAARNTDAFTSGIDPMTITIVSQDDIDTAVAGLKRSLIDAGISGTQQQKAPSEDLVAPPTCTPQTQMDRQVGDESKVFKISMKLECRALAYNRKQVQKILATMYQQNIATEQYDPNYHLEGDLRISQVVGTITDIQAGTGNLRLGVNGKLHYTFSEARKKELYQQIQGMPLDKALRVLQNQRGIVKVSASNQMSIVPMDQGRVRFKIVGE